MRAADAFGGMNKVLIAKAKANPKYTIVSFSPAEAKKRAAMFKKYHDAWIKKTPNGAKKYAVKVRTSPFLFEMPALGSHAPAPGGGG